MSHSALTIGDSFVELLPAEESQFTPAAPRKFTFKTVIDRVLNGAVHSSQLLLPPRQRPRLLLPLLLQRHLPKTKDLLL